MIQADQKTSVGRGYITYRILDRLYDYYSVTIPHLTGDRREEMVQKRQALTPQLEAAHAVLRGEYEKALKAIANDRETIANHMHSLCNSVGLEPSMALVEELVTAVTAVFDDLS